VSVLLRALTHRWTVLLCQAVLALVLLAAALTKIGDAGTFARQIHYYRLVPFGLENLIAITLPWIELLMGLAILLRLDPRAGALAGAGLMGLFVLLVGISVARGLDIECGCFGTADASHVGVAKLLENTGLFAVAIVASLRPRE
jgi:putative oxidoreductase